MEAKICNGYPRLWRVTGQSLPMGMDSTLNIARTHHSGSKILWVGCAFILTVMCISTADVVYSLRKTAARSDAVVSTFRERTHLLDRLRGLMIRSALATDSGGQRALDDTELPAAHLQAIQALEAFGSLLEASGDTGTQQRIIALRSSVDSYWHSLPEIREQNGKLPHSAQPSAGSPERRQIRSIVQQIRALNREQQDRAEAQLQAE